MNVFEVIHLGCAILSTSAEVAPFVKDYISKKTKTMTARRAFRQATVESDDEDEEEVESIRLVDSIGPDELKELMRTVQAHSEAVQENSHMISHLVSEKGRLGSFDKLSSIPEGSKIHSTFALDDDIRRLSLGTTSRDFSFPVFDNAAISTPTSRASSIAMSNPSVPSSPAMSMSSMSSLSPNEDRRPSFPPPTSPSVCIPSHTIPSSPTRTFSSASSFLPSNTSRRVSFGSPSLKASLPAKEAKNQSVKNFVEKVLAAPLPNKYRGSGESLSRTKSQVTRRNSDEMSLESAMTAPLPNKYGAPRGSLSRTMSLQIPETSQHQSGRRYERALSFPPPDHSQRQSQDTFALPQNSPSASPTPPSRMDLGRRASSFSSQTKHRHSSLQPLQPPELHRRPSDIPSKEQWRSSLRSPTTQTLTPTSPRNFSPALSRASTYSSSRTPHTSSNQTSYPTQTQSQNSIHDFFISILSLHQLRQLQQHLINIPTEQITHHASIWSYTQTLDALLHPDSDHTNTNTNSPSPPLQRTYISPTVLSHISLLAHAISASDLQTERSFNSNDRGGGDDGKAFVLLLFLLRFVMSFGVGVLRDVVTVGGQSEDPTGLREVEGRYLVARSIRGFLVEREGVGFM